VAKLLDAPKARSNEVEVLPAQQAQAAIELLRGRPLHVIATVLLGTGARRNEALALRWSDIDLDGGTLRIERALERTTRGGIVFKTPKTKWGKRTIKRVGTVATLRTHRLAQRTTTGARWEGSQRCAGVRQARRLDAAPRRDIAGVDASDATGRVQDDAAQLAAHARQHADQCQHRRAEH
jgi:hypothetical protein